MPEGSTDPGSESDGQTTIEAPVVETIETPPSLSADALLTETAEPVPAAAGVAPGAQRKAGRRWLAVGLIVIFVLAAAGGGGAYFANAGLSQTYSPQQALRSYFAAQARGDVSAMWSSATYLRGDGAYDQFFTKEGLAAMMSMSENKDIAGVKINSTRVVDSNTVVVDASMTWAGASRTYDYTMRRNTSDTHYFFYNSWKIDIPYITITLNLPNQPGDILIDGLPMPPTYAGQPVQSIAGYHTVHMSPTPFYDASAKTANAVDISPNVKFDGKINAAATAAAVSAIKAGEYTWCDASRYNTCPGHSYSSAGAAYTNYFLTGIPGYSEIQYNSYVFDFSGDLTSGMVLTVPKEKGLMYATGTCKENLTVDGSRTYFFTGTWSANLTWTNGAFKASFYADCVKDKA